MTPQQWKTICEKVTNDMLVHTRPFVTPLGTANEWNVRLVGTGSYVSRDARRMVLSCEHVAQEQPMHYRFYGSDDVFEHEGPWVMEKHPIDAAFAAISDSAWNACSHQAQVVPVERFSGSASSPSSAPHGSILPDRHFIIHLPSSSGGFLMTPMRPASLPKVRSSPRPVRFLQ